VALTASVVLLVIASTVVHSDDCGVRANDSFRTAGPDGVYRVSMSGFSPRGALAIPGSCEDVQRLTLPCLGPIQRLN
jgi:hypothetical protein